LLTGSDGCMPVTADLSWVMSEIGESAWHFGGCRSNLEICRGNEPEKAENELFGVVE
jgi:hypothetical protein